MRLSVETLRALSPHQFIDLILTKNYQRSPPASHFQECIPSNEEDSLPLFKLHIGISQHPEIYGLYRLHEPSSIKFTGDQYQ